MGLGVGALNVEGPIAQKGSSGFQVTMATKRAPTSWHRSLKEFSGILTTTHTYQSGGGMSGSNASRYHKL